MAGLGPFRPASNALHGIALSALVAVYAKEPHSNQVWSWDITKLLGPAKWTYFYLYVVLDSCGVLGYVE